MLPYHKNKNQKNRTIGIRLLLVAFGALSCGNVFANYQPESGNSLTLGVATAVEPKYSGAKKMAFTVLPVFDYQMENGLFASTLRGIGYRGEIGNFDYSAALNYRSERKSKDLRDSQDKKGTLKGMGNVKASMVADLGLGYSLTDYLSVNAQMNLPLTEDKNGNAMQVGMDALLLQTDRHQIGWNIATHFADSKYMQTYYGVTQRQSEKTGLKQYKPKAGIYAVSTELSWRYGAADGWSLTTKAGVAQLMRDASKGPLIRRKAEPGAGLMVAYTF
ncbi:MipA/OmpV family protein [Budviciaceae bacterium BWR-B9]|uniref:MipA/OmpV family protein n=1 Tax=Limnobaculum allomyrinae TaxID=2791986 RepID=A0ABS1IQ69_9GAMM|nr:MULTISPECIES: MipA/OmpV family protein [Limnobaculum]MBK5143909.1 MipA/OmpV family protein [Limnobaculum allomyrinae]MBV7691568.1 MipA/OmpV family protein [Limnobaculum sp. M2-1]